MAVVNVKDLVVKYGTSIAVDHISFSAEPGEVVGLLGPNGAGKTTTIETLEGYKKPTSGLVEILGLNPITDKTKLMPKIGVMLQQGGLYPRMKVRQALHLFASYYKNPLDPDKLLQKVGLEQASGNIWRKLSGGEKQRLSLALALIGRPSVAFLDEPTAGVDPNGRLTIRQIIRELKEEGVCILLTTHELEEAERLSNRIIIIDKGHIIASGTPAELMTSGQGEEILFGAPSGLDTVSLSKELSAPVEEQRPGEYKVHSSASPQTIAALTSWLAKNNLPLADLRAGRETLEDVFLRLTTETNPTENTTSDRNNK